MFNWNQKKIRGSNNATISSQKTVIRSGNNSIEHDGVNIFINGVDATKYLNGKGISSVSQTKNKIIINGDIDILDLMEQDGVLKDARVLEIHITGNVIGNIECSDIVIEGHVEGSINVSTGDIKCGNVNGDVKASVGNITCENVSGNVKSSVGNIKAKNINSSEIEDSVFGAGGMMENIFGKDKNNG